MIEDHMVTIADIADIADIAVRYGLTPTRVCWWTKQSWFPKPLQHPKRPRYYRLTEVVTAVHAYKTRPVYRVNPPKNCKDMM